MKPVFSIILPCWNSIDFIERCIESIKKQTFKNYEVIIIDNSSLDGTYNKINEIKDERFKVFKIDNKGILAKSRNLGIKESTAEWIAFLDSDDWWTEDKLEVCFTYLSNKVDLIYHDLEIKSKKSRLFKRKKNKSRHLKKPVLIDLLVGGNAISNSSVIVRKSILEKIGGIDENKNLPAAEDYNAWLRVAKITDQFLYLPYKLGYYFIHPQSMSDKDMSVPGRQAVAEFIEILNEKQKIKLESYLRYISGRYNYLNLDHTKAKKDLFFVLKKASISFKLRALIMIIILMIR
jgi:glycosyltransferase involved in cell wall biosynthesis